MNHCGSCTACCKVFAIPEINKPANRWCNHCAIGSGCKIYDTRPDACRDFKCLWLLSQEQGRARLPVELRPDKCKVVFSPSTDETVMAATTMPDSPDAWKRPGVRALITHLIKAGYKVAIGHPTATKRIVLDKHGMHEVQMTPPDQNGMQWSIPQSKEQIDV